MRNIDKKYIVWYNKENHRWFSGSVYMNKEVTLIMEILSSLNCEKIYNLENIDFKKMFLYCEEQKIFFLVYGKIRKEFLEKCQDLEIKDIYDRLFIKWKYKQIHIDKLMKKISSVLNGNVEYCYSKGKFISYTIYSNHLRTFNDIDIFVNPEDMLSCNNYLQSIGLKIKDFDKNDININDINSLLNQNGEIIYYDPLTNIHVELKSCDHEVSEDNVKLFLLNRRIINDMFVMSQEDMFIYLILTAYKNMYQPESIICDYIIRDFVDIYYFTKNCIADYDYVYQFFKKNNLLYVADYIFFGIKNIFKDFLYPFNIKAEEKENEIYHLNLKIGAVNTFFERKKRIREYKKMYAGSFSSKEYINNYIIFNNEKIKMNENFSFCVNADDDYIYFKYLNNNRVKNIYFCISIICNNISDCLFNIIKYTENNEIVLCDFDDFKFSNGVFCIKKEDVMFEESIIIIFSVIDQRNNTIISSRGCSCQPCSFTILKGLTGGNQ